MADSSYCMAEHQKHYKAIILQFKKQQKEKLKQ